MSKESDEFWTALGVKPRQEFLDQPAPIPVNVDLVRALYRGELSPEDEAEVEDLITCFREWSDADKQVLLELVEQHPLSATASRWSTKTVVVAILTLAASVALIVFLIRRGNDTTIVDGKHLVALTATGLTGLDPYPKESREHVSRMLRDRKLPSSPKASQLTKDLPIWRSPQNENPYAAFISPVNTAVETQKPLLKWRPFQDGDVHYEVVVSDEETGFSKKVAVTSTEWQIPIPLERGREYVWHFVAITKNGSKREPLAKFPAPRFKVLELDALQQVRADAARVQGSHLLLSLCYWNAGLLDDAQQELEILVRANPRRPILTELMGQLQRVRWQKN